MNIFVFSDLFLQYENNSYLLTSQRVNIEILHDTYPANAFFILTLMDSSTTRLFVSNNIMIESTKLRHDN